MKLGLAHLIDPRLHPLVDESRDFYVSRPARRGPDGWEELRVVRQRGGAREAPGPQPVEEVVAVGRREVPVRIHTPVGESPSAVLLELHGGGFYLGSAAESDAANRRLVDALGVAVVSVDYRLAPEHPWPAATDDAETAALWLAEHAPERFGTSTLGLVGFSAGSTLALTTLLRLRGRRRQEFDTAVLQFGTYDLSGETPAGRLIADEYFLEAYAGGVSDRTHPHLSPIYADLAELANLPPILMVVGEDDVLLEDNLAMATRLQAGGVDVVLRVYPDTPHGFTRHPTPMARAALDDIEEWLAGALD